MKTIKSIQWRAKRDALKKALSYFTYGINEEIEMLTMWIEDEENHTSLECGGLPDDITEE